MRMLRAEIERLIQQHGGVRPAARALRVDPAYLCRLREGSKTNPGESLLRRLRLRRIVSVRFIRREEGA